MTDFKTRIDEIHTRLHTDMLKDPYLTRIQVFGAHPHTGHCYVASEALYHLGAREAGFKPRAMPHMGGSHWFLQHPETGEILDPTVAQFDEAPDYARAHGIGFRTESPSKRTQAVLNSIQTGEDIVRRRIT